MESKVLLVLSLVSLVQSSPVLVTNCVNNSNPVFTQTPTASSFCGNGNGNHEYCCTESWEGLIGNTWAELFNPLIMKFEQLTNSLNSALLIIDGLHCPDSPLSSLSSNSSQTTTKSLMKSTESSLRKLTSIPWAELLSEKSNLISQECKLKIVQFTHCPGDCLPQKDKSISSKPCRNYCLNIIHGCFGILSESLQSPWKHAINSVRTALRLIHTQQCLGLPNTSLDLEFVMSNMNSWREPMNWIDGICDIISTSDNNNCYDGRVFNATYRKPLTTWTNNKNNPEITNYIEPNQILIVAREELVNITKTLEPHWPLATNHNNPLTSQEEQIFAISDEASSEYLHSDSEEDFGGSGSGFHRNFETDDEDLLDEENGSGFSNQNEEIELTNIISEPIPTIPTKKIESKSNLCCHSNYYLVFVLFLFSYR